MSDKEIQEVIAFFKALGDLSRLRLIRILSSSLAKNLGITQPAVSQHLKVLRHIGIVSSSKTGFRVYYRINKKLLNGLKETTDAVCESNHIPCPESDACETGSGVFCPMK